MEQGERSPSGSQRGGTTARDGEIHLTRQNRNSTPECNKVGGDIAREPGAAQKRCPHRNPTNVTDCNLMGTICVISDTGECRLYALYGLTADA
jgi:hypothetical protein